MRNCFRCRKTLKHRYIHFLRCFRNRDRSKAQNKCGDELEVSIFEDCLRHLDKLKNKRPALSKFHMQFCSGPAEQTEKDMRPVPPGGHDKSPSQSRCLSSRMLSDPEGAATNLPKGHTSSSTLTLSLLTPYSLQSSLRRFTLYTENV